MPVGTFLAKKPNVELEVGVELLARQLALPPQQSPQPHTTIVSLPCSPSTHSMRTYELADAVRSSLACPRTSAVV